MGGKRLKAKTKKHRTAESKVSRIQQEESIIAAPPDVRLDPTRVAPDPSISVRALFADLLNFEAVIKFLVITALMVGVPFLARRLADRYEWSVEVWGVVSVTGINVVIGLYLLIAYFEERRDWRAKMKKTQ